MLSNSGQSKVTQGYSADHFSREGPRQLCGPRGLPQARCLFVTISERLSLMETYATCPTFRLSEEYGTRISRPCLVEMRWPTTPIPIRSFLRVLSRSQPEAPSPPTSTSVKWCIQDGGSCQPIPTFLGVRTLSETRQPRRCTNRRN